MRNKKLIVISSAAILAAVAGISLFVAARPFGSSSTPEISSAPLAVGDSAPDFSVTTTDGRQFSLAAHKGNPVIIFAMFGGCGECIPVGQTLNQIQQNYASRGVAVLAVDILDGEPASTLQQYRDYIHAAFPLASYNASIAQSYHLTAPETTYVIDKNGVIADINRATLSYDQYKKELDGIL